MKTTLILLGFFIFINFGFIANKVKVKITNKSEVTIKGKSNVNSFTCKYDSDFIEDEIYVTLTKQNAKTLLEDAKISIKSNGFDCAHKMITKDFKTILKAEEYSHIKVEVKEINQQKKLVFAKVKVEIAGKTNEYTIPITLDAKNNNVKGLLKINIKDFHLKPPKKLLGMVVVNDNVEINFNLFLHY